MTEQVTEQTPAPKPPPTYRDIIDNDVVKLKRAGFENAPISDRPFFLVASDGFYLNRSTLIGRAFVRQKYYPEAFPKLGGDQFVWTTDKIPSEVIAKTIHFFRRIFDKYKTEAEVILLMNYETREWDIFVPYQKVSHSGVTSGFNPESIPDGWMIVGSIHSHCDFGAFHSGTDTGDASDMDGVHLTFGHVDKDEFEAVAMVMISGARWDFKPQEVADMENLTAEAPEEWDEKVYTYESAKDMPKDVEEIMKKYGKMRDTSTTTAVVTTSTYQKPYSKGKGKESPNNWSGTDGWYDYSSEWTEEWWSEYRRRMNLDDNYSRKNEHYEQSKRGYLAQRAKLNAPHWEDFLTDDVIDAIIDSPIFTEHDLENVTDNPWKAQDIQFWQGLFLQKMAESVNLLNKLGIVVDYHAYPKKGGKTAQLDIPDVITAQEYLLPEDTKEQKGVPVTGVAIVNGKSLEDRLRDEGFDILEVKDGGTTVVIDVSKV